MAANDSERLIFEAEWYDKVACLVKKFNLYFFPADNSVELYDLKTKKIFLRRTPCEGVEARNLYVGGAVTIFSRSMKITGVVDGLTRSKLAQKMQKTFAMIKPDVVCKMGEILKIIADHDYHIGDIKMIILTETDVEFMFEKINAPDLRNIKKYMTSGPVVAIELMGENGIERWTQIVGPDNVQQARKEAPASLRACYGKDSIENAIHASENPESAQKELDYFFPKKTKKWADTANLKNCTCCVIKPHALRARLAGHIINDIQKSGYEITALQQFHIDEPVNAEEFLEIYKGVLPEYNAMVAELQSGPCIAMEISHKDQQLEIPSEFRKLCGPMDPDIARQVRSGTLRAKYGKTKVQNAVHCSDLPEDGPLEVEYFFKFLAK